jgi:uncharacterized protein with HEPN domain
MSKSELRVSDYLEHIQQAIERIQRYTEDMRSLSCKTRWCKMR